MEISDSISAFIDEHQYDDIDKLRLSLSKKHYLDGSREKTEFAIMQLEARRKYQSKFKNLFLDCPYFLFPSILACEQASNYLVGQYHAYIATNLPEYPFRNFIDMTSGLGVDFIYIANALNDDVALNSYAIDIDTLKNDVLNHNLKLMQIKNAQTENMDSLEFIKNFAIKKSIESEHTLIFVDPARRSADNSRMYNPADCLPDIVGNQDLLLEKANVILIKNSPMLEPKEILKLYKNVRRIHIVSVKNECKEVLAEISRDAEFEGITIVNILDNKSLSHKDEFHQIAGISNFSADEWIGNQKINYISIEELSKLLTGSDKVYLYEPDSGLMKLGAWGAVSERYPDLQKISPNTHLFVSLTCYHDFPGRVTVVNELINRQRKKTLKGLKVNVITRNYPIKPEKIITELKLKSSPAADQFIYAFSSNVENQSHSKDKAFMLLTEAISNLTQNL